MKSFDVVNIMSYGLGILSFLLIYLSYGLLRKEQQRQQSRREILGTIRLYIGIVFLSILTVAFMGIPTIRNYQLLEQINDTLRVEKFQFLALYEVQRHNELILTQDEGLSKDSIDRLIFHNGNTLDSLVDVLNPMMPEEGEKVQALKNTWDEQINAILEDSTDSESEARQRIRQALIPFQEKIHQIIPKKPSP